MYALVDLTPCQPTITKLSGGIPCPEKELSSSWYTSTKLPCAVTYITKFNKHMVVVDQHKNFPADMRQRAYCGDVSLSLC
jgi:hypothetical protein